MAEGWGWGVGIQIYVSLTAGPLLLPPFPAEYQEHGRNRPFLSVHRTIAALAITSISGRWRLHRAPGLSGVRHGAGKPKRKYFFFFFFWRKRWLDRIKERESLKTLNTEKARALDPRGRRQRWAEARLAEPVQHHHGSLPRRKCVSGAPLRWRGQEGSGGCAPARLFPPQFLLYQRP